MTKYFSRATIESEDQFWHWIKDTGVHFYPKLGLSGWRMFGKLVHVFYPGWQDTSLKPQGDGLDLSKGQHGLGALPEIQEMPVLVPYLPLTPIWSGVDKKVLQHSLCSKIRLMTSGHSKGAVCLRQCRDRAAYLKCPTVLVSLIQTHFSKIFGRSN